MSVIPPEIFDKPPTPEEVLKYKTPTQTYACPLSANSAGITFHSFKIRDTTTKKNLFDTEKDLQHIPMDPSDVHYMRKIRYNFDKSILSGKEVGSTLVFSVGPQPVRNFRIVERHYFKNRVLQSFDFTFKFCIPNSTNSWDNIYHIPKLSEKEIKEICASPYEVVSDSFYFINDNQLIMHNKAEYAYTAK